MPPDSASQCRRVCATSNSSEREWKEPDSVKSTREPVSIKTFSLCTKLGRFGVCILAIGLTFIVASISFLWFLWQANDSSRTWRALVARDWVTRSIALTSLIIRQSIAFHASAATAMLAALALEHSSVLLLNLASVSASRNINGGPYMLVWWLWKAFVHNKLKRWTVFLWPVLVTALASTTLLVQLTSFALLSDLNIVAVRAPPYSKASPTHFEYNSNGVIPVITHDSTWSQNLQSYVSFAEYHEPPQSLLPDGFLDTGLTLRAFLPIADARSRSMTAQWDGIATVLDATSVCLRPTIAHPQLHYADQTLALNASFSLEFFEDPDSLGLRRLTGSQDCIGEGCNQPFVCMIPLVPMGADDDDEASRDRLSQWRLVICQPGDGALYTLQSQFQPPGNIPRGAESGPDYTFGNAYVVVNVSSGSAAEWASSIASEDANLGVLRGDGTAPLGFSVHGQNSEWYDLIYSVDARLNLSISVCYTAFDTADLLVTMQAFENHSDNTPIWNAHERKLEFTKVRAQLGQDLHGTATYSDDYTVRNIMKLHKRNSWIPEPDYGDYIVPPNRVTQTSWITDYANMAGSLQSNSYRSFIDDDRQTRFLWNTQRLQGLWSSSLVGQPADPGLIGLVQEILQSGGSLAFAMQSIVTSLSELAYYQQVQQLNGVSSVTSSFYKELSAPIRQRGLIVVTTVAGIHILLVFGVILPLFLSLTKISALGNAWQVVAQIYDEKVMPILDKAPLATDSEAESAVKISTCKKDQLKNHEVIGLRSRNGCSVEVVTKFEKTDMESVASRGTNNVTEHHIEEGSDRLEHNVLLQEHEQ